MSGVELSSPEALWLFVPVFFLSGLATLARFRTSFRFSDALEDLPRGLERWVVLPSLCLVLALGALIIALARPVRTRPPKLDPQQGIDMVLALDTSRSMLAADFQPKDRITVAKAAIRQLIQTREDRIGLVVFGGEAATWVPLTTDRKALLELLEDVRVGIFPRGTALGDAIGVSVHRLRSSQSKTKVIVLLTDGDSNAGRISPAEATQLAAAEGIRIFPILIGRGGAVPFPSGEDLFGRPIFRKQRIETNPKLLAEIADGTGGASFAASNNEELDGRLSEILDRLDRSHLANAPAPVIAEELFSPFATAGMSLLLLGFVLGTTRLRRLG